MMRSKFVAIILAALLLVIASACKERSKPAAKVAAGQPSAQVVEEGNKDILSLVTPAMLMEALGAGDFPTLTPPANASREQQLIIAAYSGDLPTIQRLIAEGADINARFEMSASNFGLGITPRPLPVSTIASEWPQLVAHLDQSALYEALLRGRLDIAAYLLDHGADVNASGNTAIQNALLAPKTLDFLIARGADVNTKDWQGRSPLHFAVALDELDAAGKLLKAGADVDALNGRRETPLHTVHDAAMARLLVAAGARLDLKDQYEFTPLMKVEWSAERIKLEWLLTSLQKALEASSSGPARRRRLSPPARGSDLDELEKVGIKGQMLSHRLNDLRETKSKGIASVLKTAGAK